MPPASEPSEPPSRGIIRGGTGWTSTTWRSSAAGCYRVLQMRVRPIGHYL